MLEAPVPGWAQPTKARMCRYDAGRQTKKAAMARGPSFNFGLPTFDCPSTTELSRRAGRSPCRKSPGLVLVIRPSDVLLDHGDQCV